jgi:hypothetical protein
MSWNDVVVAQARPAPPCCDPSVTALAASKSRTRRATHREPEPGIKQTGADGGFLPIPR